MNLPEPHWIFLVERSAWVEFRVGAGPLVTGAVAFEDDQAKTAALNLRPPITWSEYCAGIAGLMIRDDPGYSGTLRIPSP
jgi:hypothetical protein